MKTKIFLLSSLLFLDVMPVNISQTKVIIAGVCKNTAQQLPNMIKKIENLGSKFTDYRVFIYENNSSDNTPKLLKIWAQNNNKVLAFSETATYDELVARVKSRALRDKAPCRMEMIAYARNKVLQEAMQSRYDDYQLVIMTDLDFNVGWNVDEVIASCELEQEWDCLAAHGNSGSNIHYDRYAYRSASFPLGPELIGEEFWSDIGRFPVSISRESQLHPVYSAFGGLAIYKRKSLKDCSYSGYITSDLEKVMDIIINEQIAKDNRQYQVYKKLVNQSGNSRLPIRWQPNSGYDGPVCCEHSTLHATMILNRHDKIFINPKMTCRY